MDKEELKKYCDEEFSKIDRVKEDLFSVYLHEKPEYLISEQAAIAAFIVNIYSGIENILKEMLIYDQLDVNDSPEWHAKVLKKAGEIGILPPELFQILSGYLAFRNFFIYKYIYEVSWEELKVLVDAIGDLIEKLKSEIDEYIQTI